MREFYTLQLLRFILFACLVSFLVQLGQAGVSLILLLLSIASGMWFAGKWLKNKNSAKKIFFYHLLAFLGLHFSSKALNWLVISTFDDLSEADFFIPIISETSLVLIIFYTCSLISTWLFWTKSWALVLEVISTSAILIYTLAAHREYHVDAPKEISSLSWKLGFLQAYDIQPQHIFMSIGGLIFLGFCCFAFLANNRNLFGQTEKVRDKGAKSFVSISTSLLLLALILGVLAWQINARYNQDLSRIANGVGSNKDLEQGQSNLGFHQAVSSTKQPTALVRLEGDYQQNPWKPMLYFREGALSEYNGRELVKASRKFDQDIPIISAGQSYLGDINKKAENRTKLVQSIYLLSEHSSLFSVDFPQKITPIKNPYPEKFKYSYQVSSLAPAYNLGDLSGLSVGDPSWDNDTWQHYLRAPGSKSKASYSPLANQDQPALDKSGEDLRYLDMAEKLSTGLSDPVSLAKNFAKYLSDQSIYTKEPGHQVTEKGDPVAPYLFTKDKRGFCVHFAHSMVYLLRLMGIPSRIATGYLTELSYAKDGHILLQTGDRHAWAEAYLQDYGWVVFDVTPSRVENEEPLIPDESLLQELMSKLTPVEELLAPEIKDIEEESPTKEIFKKLRPVLTYLITAIFILFLIIKSWLRYAYLLVNNPRTKTILAYQAFASSMIDLNRERYFGETRKEYASRLLRQGIDGMELTSELENVIYGANNSTNNTSLAGTRNLFLAKMLKQTTSKFSLIKRVLSFFNPSSIARIKKW